MMRFDLTQALGIVRYTREALTLPENAKTPTGSDGPRVIEDYANIGPNKSLDDYITANELCGIRRKTLDWIYQNEEMHPVLSRSGPKTETAKTEPSGDYFLDESSPPSIQKSKGTWSLNHAISDGLDFFVLLSSFAGVSGASSQENYTAESGFLGALARYQHSRSHAASGRPLARGEHRTLATTPKEQKYITELNLYFMLRYACRPLYADKSSYAWDTQLIDDMTISAFMRRAGIVQDYNWMQSPSSATWTR
ncbi:hypothetical protein BKA67DRAFT_538125 [Truncatella angustata]|uniref:Ketoreductase (KR) domain-containing protein n=1 Tax=Truncatella angustata TaxID=152316 RepID=A0A9P8ZV61_9PEZI|nr:uncharacterized protein BKA67DRAFT_538125 [Truncatella angustata]KAH6652304.1 hypothetical protein BKA67DRAFT_538125 [Truncatella angustata]